MQILHFEKLFCFSQYRHYIQIGPFVLMTALPKVRKSKIFIKTQLCFEREQCMGKLLFLPAADFCQCCRLSWKIVFLRRKAFENLKMHATFYMMEICTYKKQIATRGYYGRSLAFNEGNLHLSWRQP